MADRLTAEQLCTLEMHAVSVMSELSALGIGYFKRPLRSRTKADRSFVTEADQQLELRARALLSACTPDWGFVGEEFGPLCSLKNHSAANPAKPEKKNPRVDVGLKAFETTLTERPGEELNLDEETYWILDPIDGTSNFLSMVPTWSILLALVEKGKPVLGVVALPALDEIFVASVGNGARYGKLSLCAATQPHQDWLICQGGASKALSESFLSWSTPRTFAQRGIDSFLSVLQEKALECRTHSDAFGYTRILLGGIDAMLDPIVAPYDTAALQVLFDETPGAVFTTLHGQQGSFRFRAGNALAASSRQLADELIGCYHTHLKQTATTHCAATPELASPLIPERFAPTYLLPIESAASTFPSKIWVRSVETATAFFMERHPNAFVEDVSVLLGSRESASRALSNGQDEGPPDVSASSSFHIRAIVCGGTGLMTGTLSEMLSPVECILSALEAAWEQREFNTPADSTRKILASREQVISHCGQHPWQTVRFAPEFQAVSHLIQKHHQLPHDSRIHSLKSRLNMSTEYCWQYFMDSAQQTYVNQVCRISTNATCAEGEEKRTAYARHLQNGLPDLTHLDDELMHHFSKVMEQSLALLSASLVPENPEYDYLAVDADLLGLILHEAIGHAAEGDLIQTGASGFGENGQLKNLQVGPEWMDILVDGSLDNCGYLPVDAEGVKPRRKLLVKNGRLVDAIHTRHTALVAGKNPDGCARMQSLQYPSLNRMTSIWVCPEKTKPIDIHPSDSPWDQLSPEVVQNSLAQNGYLDGSKGVLLLSGWKGGTASCSNLEFRADVARVLLLKKGQQPVLMREANFTGIATECFRSAIDAFGPILCRSIGTCGKDGQGVLTSDGGPAFMVFTPHPKVRVIGTGDSDGGDE